jgi:hypothetical protein
MWLPFGLYLTGTLERGAEPMLWSPIYAGVMLMQVSPYAMVSGAFVGAVMAFFREKDHAAKGKRD